MRSPLPAPAALGAFLMLSLIGCMEAGPVTGPGIEGPLAPPVPRDERSHGMFQQITGINGDAVSAVTGDAKRSYIYYDLFAAKKPAVAAAPAKLCASYGKGLGSFYTTEPADREPGLKVLVVDCAS